MVAPARSTTWAELNLGEISSLNQSRATLGAWASTLPLGGSDRTRSACALAGWASNSVAAAAPTASAAPRKKTRTAEAPSRFCVVLNPHGSSLSLDHDVLHLGVAEQHGYLAAAVHPVAGVLEDEVVADGRLQLPMVGVAHQQPVQDEPGVLIDDRRRRPGLVHGRGLVRIDDLIPQVEKSSARSYRHPDKPHAAAPGQAGRGHGRALPCGRRSGAGCGAGPGAGVLQPQRQRPDSRCDEHTGQEPGDPDRYGQPEPAPPSGSGGAGSGPGPGERRTTAHHG